MHPYLNVLSRMMGEPRRSQFRLRSHGADEAVQRRRGNLEDLRFVLVADESYCGELLTGALGLTGLAGDPPKPEPEVPPKPEPLDPPNPDPLLEPNPDPLLEPYPPFEPGPEPLPRLNPPLVPPFAPVPPFTPVLVPLPLIVPPLATTVF